jgi:uncharacterized protein (TIGR02145 family)
MKKSTKPIGLLLLAMSILGVVLVCCNSSKDPYDEGFPAEKWTPSNLEAEASDSGVCLSWEQKVENIDGFIIERSRDSSNWEFLTKKMLESSEREYLDSDVVTGGVYFYRLYAKAGNYVSNYCYSNAVVVPLQLPTVLTYDATEIDSLSARFNGAVTKDGGRTVTERGFCYDTIQTPTIKKKKIASGSGIGAYTTAISKLNYGTTYYVRAYATNENGISYGKEKSFKTLPEVGEVAIDSISAIDSTSATIYGRIISDGRGTIKEIGVCYALFTSQGPDITDMKVNTTVVKGNFSVKVSGLIWDERYTAKAYILNDAGLSYGRNITFNTCSCNDKFEYFTDSRDSHQYKAIKIGTQTWMAENLAYLPSVNNISESSPTIGKYYVYYYVGTIVSEAKATKNYTAYGVLYNWPAAMAGASSSSYAPSGVKGICPDGWHLPSDAEWTTLSGYLTNKGFGYGGSGDGIAKALASRTGWGSSFRDGTPGNDPGSNNSSCFSALPGGGNCKSSALYDANGNRAALYCVIDAGNNSLWWSSTANGTDYAWDRNMYDAGTRLQRSSSFRYFGESVRCVRDN